MSERAGGAGDAVGPAARATRRTPARPPRVGILGGTFDPVHLAHLLAAEACRGDLALDRVLFVPAGTPPHKLGAAMSAGHDRLAMVELAITGNGAFVASRVDLDRPGPHFTVDTLGLVRAELGLAPDDDLWFIMGADSLVDLPTWRDPPGIVARARLAVVGRPGHAPDLEALDRAVPGIAGRVDVVPMPLVGVSGTELRRCVAEGRSIRYQVPDAVATYIVDHGLYRASEGRPPDRSTDGASGSVRQGEDPVA